METNNQEWCYVSSAAAINTLKAVFVTIDTFLAGKTATPTSVLIYQSYILSHDCLTAAEGWKSWTPKRMCYIALLWCYSQPQIDVGAVWLIELLFMKNICYRRRLFYFDEGLIFTLAFEFRAIKVFNEVRCRWELGSATTEKNSSVQLQTVTKVQDSVLYVTHQKENSYWINVLFIGTHVALNKSFFSQETKATYMFETKQEREREGEGWRKFVKVVHRWSRALIRYQAKAWKAAASCLSTCRQKD